MKKVFEDTWGLILGASSGLGLASAQKMASHGMNLILIHRDRKSEMEEIDMAFDSMRALGVIVESFNVDAVNEVKMRTIVKEIELILGDNTLKLMLHSIAKGNLKAIISDDASLKSDDFALTINSMAISLYSWTKTLLEHELFANDARILSFTSEGSQRVHTNYAAISAAKASLESITRSLALELAKYNIKANCIMAGTTDTKAFRAIPNHNDLSDWSIKRNPYNRLTTAREVANAVYIMCLDESSWINGITLQVDGGEHLR